MLERQIELARRVAVWICDSAEYELLPVAETRKEMIAKTFMIVLFRSTHTCHNDRLVERINKGGQIYVTGTSWDGRSAARIAVSNWQATAEKDQSCFD